MRALLVGILVWVLSHYFGDLKYAIHAFIYGVQSFFLLNFLRQINKRFAIIDFIGLIYFTMYCVAPALMFDLGSQQFFHPMMFGYDILAIDPIIYYRFAIGSSLLLYIGLMTATKSISKDKILEIKKNLQANYNLIKIAKLFILIAIASTLLHGLIGPLNFLFYLGGKLSALLLILSLFMERKKDRLIYFLIGFSVLFLHSARSAMFGEMLYMLIFYGLFRGVLYGFSLRLRIVAPIAGILGVTFLQVFKNVYRAEIWGGTEAGGLSSFYKTISNLASGVNTDFFLVAINGLLFRLNQAYLSSRTMVQVPNKLPFAKGETLLEALYSFIPRLFWPNKPLLSDRDLMKRYGGYDPDSFVSMGIGQLGEAYVNFGYVGGAILILFYGLILALLLSIIIKKNKIGKPTILFVPLYFFYAMKAEIIFSKVFNYGLKAFVFSLIILWLIDKFCLKQNDTN